MVNMKTYVLSFHPFQGRPPFGQNSAHSYLMKTSCFHPFQGRPPFGHRVSKITPEQARQSFHPFQGRPPFGRLKTNAFIPGDEETLFPSLSGKTSIRTPRRIYHFQPRGPEVSIPFREDLHSDTYRAHPFSPSEDGFHPFQGRPPFGPSVHQKRQDHRNRVVCFHPFQGRPPFGRLLRR